MSKSSERVAIGFDLGTTTIAAGLFDPSTGEMLGITGGLNPQRKFGLDVVSRLDAALNCTGALAEMKSAVNVELERMVLELLDGAERKITDLKLVAIAGNPAMEHILLGLPVRSLAFPPYRPLFTSGRTVSTEELGWRNSFDAHIFPMPGGFVGGDLVAFLNGHKTDRGDGAFPAARIYLDLGTNGEIALERGGRIFATSAAAGPAFEGGNIACGMAALKGAISGVFLEEERVRIDVIGEGIPEGICGSGVMSAVSELLRAGIIDYSGRLLQPSEIRNNLANRVIEIKGEAAFVLYRDAGRTVYLGQNDIRQVQLAKAAVRAGVEVLLERAATTESEINDVILTGSFGAHIDPGSLKNVGILPEKMVELCRFEREGALAGIGKSICSPGGFAEIDALAGAIRVIPLSGTPLFEKHFLEQMNFPAL
jgi:uncharacterized 2Fe-2S/4Fe-4S cluster protein (DUF4445 family)